jgi:hypothetical protein
VFCCHWPCARTLISIGSEPTQEIKWLSVDPWKGNRLAYFWTTYGCWLTRYWIDVTVRNVQDAFRWFVFFFWYNRAYNTCTAILYFVSVRCGGNLNTLLRRRSGPSDHFKSTPGVFAPTLECSDGHLDRVERAKGRYFGRVTFVFRK